LNANGSLDGGFDPGSGADFGVYALAVQTDGKVVVGGDFASINGMDRNFIGRLNANGSLDTGFNSSTGPDSTVFSIGLQTDGKVLLGGQFNSINGTSRASIARLNV